MCLKVKIMKQFNGRAIYNPSGKAGEYSRWACNFYVGCSNGCTYCYCKKGILAGAMGQDEPQLKKCFQSHEHALEIFEKELKQNLSELQKYGLFFSFTTDPMLKGVIVTTLWAIAISLRNDVPVKVLTKRADFIDFRIFKYVPKLPLHLKSKIAFGFTLTGHDELEPHASSNAERIEAMRELHNAGFKTFASIEPVIDIASSRRMIAMCEDFCDLFKIGLESGKKYSKPALASFVDWCTLPSSATNKYITIYFKDSLLKAAGIDRETLLENCVGRDYNIFTNQ